MKIRIFYIQSKIANTKITIQVFVNDDDKWNPPHCHVRYDDGAGMIIGEFRVSLINAEILSNKNDNGLNEFLCKKDKDTFAEKMNNRPDVFWNLYSGTSWELACCLWNNDIQDDIRFNNQKDSIPDDAQIPDYTTLPFTTSI